MIITLSARQIERTKWYKQELGALYITADKLTSPLDPLLASLAHFNSSQAARTHARKHARKHARTCMYARTHARARHTRARKQYYDMRAFVSGAVKQERGALHPYIIYIYIYIYIYMLMCGVYYIYMPNI